MAASKSNRPESSTNGMQGEDYNYGGAGPKSDVKKPAVVSGKVKQTSKGAAAPKPAKGTTDDPDWGTRKQGQQMPGGLAEAESAGKKAKDSK